MWVEVAKLGNMVLNALAACSVFYSSEVSSSRRKKHKVTVPEGRNSFKIVVHLPEEFDYAT